MGVPAFVILGLDPRIHAETCVKLAAVENVADAERLILYLRPVVGITAWIPGSARVASLLAPPWNDEVAKATILTPR
ncbi:hypothetical protein [Mesorhizobium atlanticum]|uniref:Uncharacterized protein n=1 Tax=Mesorhizobium atlanticum TaxID=2233532 RepID=A0A330GXH1_9HYPH|nr:hypothetical protein [Mesorhizobium atlanticum]RAZ74476.1 hypothetical protein DPM35_22410 [Mesorhizobium atlanticum]